MDLEATMPKRAALIALLAGAVGLSAADIGPARAETLFQRLNLVSDGKVPAVITDPNLVNPWGIAESSGSPFWISDNGTGVATLYRVPGAGNTPVSAVALVVAIPPAGEAAPTGQVFNGTTGFQVNGKPAVFLFDSEDGRITGWNGGTTAAVAVDNSSSGAVYKGLAIDPAGGSLFAANFNSGNIEMYNNAFSLTKTLVDPSQPAGYAPFDVRVLNGKLYATFAVQDSDKHDDVEGAGHGFVDVFDLNGDFLTRLVQPGGELNSPWGLEIAPSSFGTFAGDLLVGNFGDGTIDAFNPTTGAFVDALRGPDGNPIHLTDLWGLTLGNGGMGGSADALYFTAGLAGEADGLFGSLTVVPEPSTWAMMTLGFAALSFAGYRRARIGRAAVGAARLS